MQQKAVNKSLKKGIEIGEVGAIKIKISLFFFERIDDEERKNGAELR